MYMDYKLFVFRVCKLKEIFSAKKHWSALKCIKKICSSQTEHFNSLRSMVTICRLRKGTDISDSKKVILNLKYSLHMNF